MKAAFVVLAALVLGACASAPPAPVADRTGLATAVEGRAQAQASMPATALDGKTYTVRRGDTLFAIALDHGLDYRELAQWNTLENPNRLLVGQVLRLTPAGGATAPADAAVQVKPVAAPAAVQIRPLDTATSPVAAQAATPVAALPSSAPAAAGDYGGAVKRGPKGGSIAFSEEALARLKQMESGAGKPVAAAPVATVPDSASMSGAAAPVPVAAPQPAPAAPTAPPPGSAPAPVAGAMASAAPAPAPGLAWIWPAPGKVLVGFSEGTNKGIDIAGKPGEPVVAAAPGKISYVGSSLRGYGKMVVVKHAGEFLSVYAHNNTVLVSEGQSVSAGQKIAELGSTDTDSPKLHFEIRRQGKPVDPVALLPAR